MRTGLTKRQKTTEIFFDETKSRITVYTHNTDLKKRLTAYAERYPDHCTMTDEEAKDYLYHAVHSEEAKAFLKKRAEGGVTE